MGTSAPTQYEMIAALTGYMQLSAKKGQWNRVNSSAPPVSKGEVRLPNLKDTDQLSDPEDTDSNTSHALDSDFTPRFNKRRNLKRDTIGTDVAVTPAMEGHLLEFLDARVASNTTSASWGRVIAVYDSLCKRKKIPTMCWEDFERIR